MLADVTQPQQERLFHIDFLALCTGRVTRQAITRRFGIKGAAATRDLALYRALAPRNLTFDTVSKSYDIAPAFQPLFDHDPLRTLRAISEGIGDDAAGPIVPHVRSEHPLRLNPPSLEVVTSVSRAIAGSGAIKVVYSSLTSGETEREIVPHALVDTGARWHVRAFDRRRERFGDFVLTRMLSVQESDRDPRSNKMREADDQWMRFVELELVPHPGLTRPEPVMRDYAMQDGVLKVRLRAALCGYALVHWSVDVSPDHRLDPARHHLWLRNREALYGVENLIIAPGYSRA